MSAAQDAMSFIAMAQKNPAYISTYIAVLSKARTEIERSELADFADGLEGRPAACIQSSQSIITMLVRVGMLDEHVFLNGMLFEAGREGLVKKEDLTDGDEIVYKVVIAEGGIIALEELDPSVRIADLITVKSRHVPAFRRVLELCSVQNGVQPTEIAEALKVSGALCFDPQTNLPTVYPAFFTSELEKAGALVWNGAWFITQAGKTALAGMSAQ